MPRLSTSSKFYRSVKSNDSTADRYVTFGSHATYLLNTAGGMSIWAKRGAWRSDGENIMELYGTGGYVRISMTGRLMSLTAFANSSTIASTSYSIPNNALESWHNVVVTWDSSSMDVYLDKTKVITVSGDKQLSFSANPTFYVGAGNAAGSGFFFDGYHTRAALYNAKLSQSDVDKIWLTVSPSSEVAAWDYTDITGSTLTLTRGSGNNGTIIQGSIVDDVPIRPRQKLRNIPYAVGITTGKIQSASNSGISGSGAWTMGGWILINKENGTGLSNDLAFATTGGGVVCPYVGADGNAFSIGYTGLLCTSTVKMADYVGKWVHLAGSYSGGTNGTFKIFLNGRQIFSQTLAGTPSLTDGAFTVNNYLNTGSYQMYANFAEVFWATSALSETEIFNLAYGIATPTLAGYWKLDEGSGTTATDSSGNGNTGTITSGTWATNSPMKNRFLIKNYPYSLNFNGSTQYGVTSGSVPMSSATKLTVAIWVKINAATAGPQIVMGTINNAASNNGWEIEYDNNAVLAKAFVFLCNRGATLNYAYTAAMQPGYWYRIVGVYDGSLAAAGRTKIYVNGVLPANSTFSGATTGGFDDAPITIGDRTTSGFKLSGRIAQAKVLTGVAWTPTDVWNDFCDFTTTGTPVVNYNFTDGSGTSVTDSSGGGYNIGLVNTPTWGSTDVPRTSRTQIPKQNILLYSEQFDQASWLKQNVTVSANAAVAPDGNTTADLVYPTTTGTFRSIYRTATNAKLYYDNTVSVYAKAAGLNYITFIDFIIGSNGTVWFNLSNGTIGTSATGYTGTITDVGGGWYRCSVKGKMSSSAAFCQIVLADADNSTTATTNGTNGVYLWGAQWNTTTQATDYQVTTSAAVNTGTPRVRIT